MAGALESVHPGNTVEEIIANIGFAFERPAAVPDTPAPEPQVLALIRDEIAETYPQFAAGFAA